MRPVSAGIIAEFENGVVGGHQASNRICLFVDPAFENGMVKATLCGDSTGAQFPASHAEKMVATGNFRWCPDCLSRNAG